MPRPAHKRNQQKSPPTKAEMVQAQVEEQADELLLLWRLLPSALARDSAGQLTGDRHPTGGSKGSAAAANLEVIEVAVLVETGVLLFAAEAVPILNLDPRRRTTDEVIKSIGKWHRTLAAAQQPLARHLAKDLHRWVRAARGAIGIRKHDQQLGALCPDHRDDHPSRLLEVGAEAQIAATLLAGPPTDGTLLDGPACGDIECGHPSCASIREQRLFVITNKGRLHATDWIVGRGGEPSWSSLVAAPPWTWKPGGAIRCPHCRVVWSTLEERRMLARRLAELGDTRPSGLRT